MPNEWIVGIMANHLKKLRMEQFYAEFDEWIEKYGEEKAYDKLMERLIEYREYMVQKHYIHGFYLHILQLGRYIKK